MARVLGFTPLELRPGVDEREFIRFFNEQYAPLAARIGWKGSVLKADRGERAGKLAAIWEIPSVEQRNHFVPQQDQMTQECRQLLGPEFSEASKKLNAYLIGWPFTDYIVQEE